MIINTVVGTTTVMVDLIIIGFVILGSILFTIVLYLIANSIGINVSFLRAFVVSILSGVGSFFIIIIFLLMSNGNIAVFFTGWVVAFIVVLIIFKYILNVSWEKAISILIIIVIPWFIIGLILSLLFIFVLSSIG
jgi:hypothetical protein